MEWDASRTGDHQIRRLIVQGANLPASEVLVRGYRHVIIAHSVAMHRKAGQEVFLDAYAALARFRPDAPLRIGFLAVTRTQCLS